MKAVFLFLLLPFQTLLAVPVKPPEHLYSREKNFNGHPGHFPFVSDLTFRAISDFVIDQNTDSFEPEDVKQGDIIYLNAWYMPWFEKYVHDQIKFPYILITCDVGCWFPDYAAISKLLYDPKLAAWFCKNIIFSYHPKLFQVPMGQTIYYFENPDTAASFRYLFNLSLQKRPKEHFLYMNHFPRKHGDRDKIIQLFENEPYCFSCNHTGQDFVYLSKEEYFEDLARSRFTLSPFGLETDCVRTWEALVLDCIPVVEHTFVDSLLEDLPVVFVHEWEEINEDFLASKYLELKDLKYDKAYFAYWHQLIKDMKQKIKEDDMSFAKLEATLFSPEDLQDLSYLLQDYLGGDLICKGFLTTLRPLQLADGLFNKIYLYDPWQTTESFHRMITYLDDFFFFLRNSPKIELLIPKSHTQDPVYASENLFQNMLFETICPVFLDLTYHRNSLLRDFNNLRHALKKDLWALYEQLQYGRVLCGNMATNNYVKEVLERLSKERGLTFQIQGNFWSVVKCDTF